MKKIVLAALFFTGVLNSRSEVAITPATNPAQPASKAQSVCLTSEEMKLVEGMNNYRRGKGLPALQPTKSMSYVAKTHAADLADNRPASGSCNMHSWSSRGPWSPCCYTGDHKQAQCMWKKPQELSAYKGSGFEISAGGSGSIDAATSLRVWQGSSGHNAVIINQGMWNQPWKAFGVGIYNGYAVAWFGNEADPMGVAGLCK